MSVSNSVDMGRNLAIFIVLTLFLASSVQAVGVARPYFSSNTFNMDVDESEILTFQLQNGESVQKTILFRVSSQEPFLVGGADSNGNAIFSGATNVFERQYTLNAMSYQDVKLAFKSAEEGTFRIEYSYSEASAGGGTVTFESKISDFFYAEVGDGGVYHGLGLQLNYTNYDFTTSSLTIRNIDDLMLQSDYLSVDFLDALDMSGYQEQYIQVSAKKIIVDSTNFPEFKNESAKIIFNNIKANYSILRNGVACGSYCHNIYYYSGTKKLSVTVDGFSTYEVTDSDPSQSSTSNSSSSTHTSTSSGSVSPVVTPTQPPAPAPPSTPVTSVVNQNPESNTVTTPPASIQPKANTQVQPEVQPEKENKVINTDGKTTLLGIVVLGFIGFIISMVVLFRARSEGDEDNNKGDSNEIEDY